MTTMFMTFMLLLLVVRHGLRSQDTRVAEAEADDEFAAAAADVAPAAASSSGKTLTSCGVAQGQRFSVDN